MSRKATFVAVGAMTLGLLSVSVPALAAKPANCRNGCPTSSPSPTASPTSAATSPSPSPSASPSATTSAAPSPSASSTSPSPSPSPTSSPSPSPSATSVAPSPSPSVGGSTTAPDTQGSWTSPEGAKLNVNSAGPWTIRRVYQLLLDNAAGPGDFARIAPTVTINVQDTYASSTGTSATTGSTGAYAGFRATIYLKGVSSTFASQPDAQLAHEYGHAWTLYHLYMSRQGDWSSYVNNRWDSVDGSVSLAGDTRLDTSYTWDRKEIMADDYRLLFGTATAISQRPTHLNPQIADPRNQPGLKAFFTSTWAS